MISFPCPTRKPPPRKSKILSNKPEPDPLGPIPRDPFRPHSLIERPLARPDIRLRGSDEPGPLEHLPEEEEAEVDRDAGVAGHEVVDVERFPARVRGKDVEAVEEGDEGEVGEVGLEGGAEGHMVVVLTTGARVGGFWVGWWLATGGGRVDVGDGGDRGWVDHGVGNSGRVGGSVFAFRALALRAR